jgi:DNA modification methylase/superfamily II DNA or RNA helicase
MIRRGVYPMTTYEQFLQEKKISVTSCGQSVSPDELHKSLFPFQRALVIWALKKGRAAIFADTGLGKSLMQLEWARHAAKRTLILAPLAVARQTVREGAKWGIDVTYARNQQSAPSTGITITNYEMLHHFDLSQFGAVVLDESSILKSQDGKTRTALIEACAEMPMRLCCTATPAPNDIAEIGNHAEFLGHMRNVEMLSAFFLHDDQGWRLRGHAREPFYRWMASWAMSLKRPSDLGFSDAGYALPPLSIEPIIIDTDTRPDDRLFYSGLKGITERSTMRKSSLCARVESAANLIMSHSKEQWLVWVGLNDEGRELAKSIPGSVLVEGNQTPEQKADALEKFANGETRVMVTKCSIAGFGLNFQNCARMLFCGIGDSYEQYYQAIRRCWRFGQTREVKAFVVLSEPERVIYNNILRKEAEAQQMASELIQHVADYERAEIEAQDRSFRYREDDKQGKDWTMLLGDSAERLKEIEDNSIALSVFSPPFQSIYTYSPTERDLGNCRTEDEFWHHFEFISRELKRVMMPGRNVCVHVAQLTSTKVSDGVIGLKDFRGATIRHFEDAGFTYHGEVCIDKCPQAQAIRTHSKGLLFVQLKRDASWLRPALADYILVFRAPGENAVPVLPDISNDEWIEWARPIWYGIKETDTLNTVVAKENNDERHICPLQLGTIERCVRLWSNPGELVLSPFAGIGSEGFQSIKNGRRFVGIELKPTYFEVACRNLQSATVQATQTSVLDFMEDDNE